MAVDLLEEKDDENHPTGFHFTCDKVRVWGFKTEEEAQKACEIEAIFQAEESLRKKVSGLVYLFESSKKSNPHHLITNLLLHQL